MDILLYIDILQIPQNLGNFSIS